MSTRPRRRLKAKSKVWLELDGRPVFGDGKADILERIERTKSLMATAEALGMSYRALWGRLRTMERRLGLALVERHVGGRGGGGTRLTAEGRAVLRQFRKFREGINAGVDARFQKVFGRAAAPQRRRPGRRSRS